MRSLVRKFGLVTTAALALALVPGSAWGQSQTPAKGATGKKGSPAPTGQPNASEVRKKAEQMRTEAGRRAAAQAELKAEAAKEKEAANSGKSAAQVSNANKTSGFIVEKGDPFTVPIKAPPSTTASAKDLPPGQAGLLVSQADLQGIVKMSGGNRAVIHGPSDRTYFLKVNDKVYNARVTKVTDDAIYFEETTVDPLGKTTKREIVKTLPSDAKKP
jgi:hypothetical protein